jgi:multiple sugar transport system permease protein
MKQEARWGLLLALPAIIGFVAFTFLPMIASAVISLTDWTIGAAPKFVGLANYKRMFTADDSFYKSLWATVYYTLGAVPLLLIVAFGVALLLNQPVRGQSLFRVIYYLPAIVPIVANSMLWIWLFNPDFGLLNTLTEKAGLPRSQWIFDESTAIPSLILMSVWGFGNVAVIFLAGLQGVPRQLYEAIAVDGGGAWRKFRHITLPMMTPTIFYSLVTSVIGALQVFVQAAVMTEGGPNDSTLFYIYYLYRTAFTNNEMGYASALAWVLFLVIMAITVVLFRNSSRWVYYEAGSAR